MLTSVFSHKSTVIITCACYLQNNNALYMKSRVPMDFSGDRGHVVTDPNEALTIAFEEAYNWRVIE